MGGEPSLLSQGIKGFLVGVIAGAVALAISYILRLFAGGVFLPELASEALFSVTPGQVESSAIQNLGPLAKYSAFSGSIAINLLLYGFVGHLLYRYSPYLSRRGSGTRFYAFSLTAFALFSVLTLAFLGLAQVLSQPVFLPLVMVYALPPNIAFGIVLSALHGRVFPAQPTECRALDVGKGGYSRKRRLVIKSGIAAAIAGTILLYGLEVLMPQQDQPRVPSSVSTLFAQDVTANDKFYRVDVNIILPEVNSKQWTLAVGGIVNNQLSLSYEDVAGMGVVEQYNTLECVSNNIGDNLISTAKWSGVRLKDVLARSGIGEGAKYIVFKCADGYDVGIPLETGLLDGTLLAYEMNGAPLPREHGFPLRAIVPGLYGMMNAKWITEIALVNNVYEGYWQRRGWANDAHYQTGSEIVIPGVSDIDLRFGIDGASNVLLGGNIPIAGVAFAGDRGIEKVEVSTDGGRTWSLASLKDPLSQYTWVLWSAEWNPPSEGAYSIVVRATDKTGTVQTARLSSPFPNGATGYHAVDIRVVHNS